MQNAIMKTDFSPKWNAQLKNRFRGLWVTFEGTISRNLSPIGWGPKNGLIGTPPLTHSYSFLGWNLPGITMSLESLHNYFGIPVKNRKNYQKFSFSDNTINFFSTTKNSSVWHPKNGRFGDSETEPETPLGISNFFFSKFNLFLQFFRVKFTGNYYVIEIIIK